MEGQPMNPTPRPIATETLRVGVVIVLVALLTGTAFVGGFLVGNVSSSSSTVYRLPADGTPYPNGGTYVSGACPGADAQGYPFGFPLPDVERLNNPNIP